MFIIRWIEEAIAERKARREHERRKVAEEINEMAEGPEKELRKRVLSMWIHGDWPYG